MNVRSLLAVGALLLSACGEPTAPSAAATIALSVQGITLDALGASTTVVATVKNAHGDVIDEPVQWTMSAPVLGIVPTNDNSATLVAAANGTGTLVATAGAAHATSGVQVRQRPAAIERLAGDHQSGPVSTALEAPLRARVTDRLGNPVAAQPVSFIVAKGGGSIGQSGPLTNTEGIATAVWTLGSNISVAQEVVVTADGLTQATFSASGTAGAVSGITAVAGNNQTGPVGSPLATAPAVKVVDAAGNPVADAVVTFAVGSGGGVVPGGAVPANANGIASVGSWLLGTSSGSQTLVATVPGLAPVTFTATATPGRAVSAVLAAGDGQVATPGTAVPIAPAIRIIDGYGNGVAGVVVRFTVTAGGGTVSGPVKTTTADGGAAVGQWTLGSALGANILVATVPDSAIPPVTLLATSAFATGPPTVRFITDEQLAAPNVAFPEPVRIEARDAAGRLLNGVRVTFVPGNGSRVFPETAITNGVGQAQTTWTLGPLAIPAVLNATVDSDNGSTSASFRSAVCPRSVGPPPFFNPLIVETPGWQVTMCYLSDLTPSQAAAFQAAVARWETILTFNPAGLTLSGSAGACGNTPKFQFTPIDDIMVFASVEDIDGPGGVLGSAGWCVRRVGGVPIIGVMRFDAADLAALEAEGNLSAVILHEMGHTLGFGTLWESKAVLQDASSVGGPALDTYYNGLNAVQAFNLAGGATYSGKKIPVENSFGAGTINAHWRESVFANELMTGFLNSGPNPLSAISIQSMVDLGYTVSTSGADPFAFNFGTLLTAPTPGAALNASLRTRTLAGDTYTGQQYTVDASGRQVRIR